MTRLRQKYKSLKQKYERSLQRHKIQVEEYSQPIVKLAYTYDVSDFEWHAIKFSDFDLEDCILKEAAHAIGKEMIKNGLIELQKTKLYGMTEFRCEVRIVTPPKS